MSKKVKITSLSLGVIAILSVGAVGAYQSSQKEKDFAACIHARTFEMRAKPPRDEANARRVEQLISTEEEICRKNVYMSAKERAKITGEKKRLHEETLRLQEEQRQQGFLEPGPPKRLPEEMLGVRDGMGDEVRATMDKMTAQLNFWRGYFNENDLDSLVTVTAAYSHSDPMQGFVIVTSGFDSREEFATPTATGPVKILSEKNGVLTLKSLPGTWDVYGSLDEPADEHGKISTPGGVTYYFDVRTGTFQ